MKKKICVVTAARSEYGLLKGIMKRIQESEVFSLDILITGAHLSNKQGHTVDLIREDGFCTDNMLDLGECGTTSAEIAQTMGRLASQIVPWFQKLSPDYICVLGDRYELLPICNAAYIMGIPIIHISGGDVTEGSLDNGIRNAVTMLATYHFPGTEQSAANIRRMTGNDKNIWCIGEPGLDAFFTGKDMTREELADSLGLNMKTRWGLLTYHPETVGTTEHDLEVISNTIICLTELDNTQVIATYANADRGGDAINEYLIKASVKYPDKIRVIPSLGQYRYLNFMKKAEFVIGNSSSGIVEAPMLNVPVVNIGKRQQGRYMCSNIIQSDGRADNIREAVNKALNYDQAECSDRFYWGNGNTAEQFISILEKILR